MTDYVTKTVIQPNIPITDMTPFERLILSHCFEYEENKGEIYFFASECISSDLTIEREELSLAISTSKPHLSSILQTVAEQIEAQNPKDHEIELDLSGDSAWEGILQDIVRRSDTIQYFTAVSSFDCTKMRSDGFGGMVALITADEVRGKSTYDVLEELMNAAKVGDYNPTHLQTTGTARV